MQHSSPHWVIYLLETSKYFMYSPIILPLLQYVTDAAYFISSWFIT